MGVVHKLQDEVRDFILAQKKIFPQISCRKLSDVVFQKFQLIVSKSSISSVLKSANLNSPIGRHSLSGDARPAFAKTEIKKFKIPQHKKSQIFLDKNLPFVEEKKVLVGQEMSNLENVPEQKSMVQAIESKGTLVQNAGVIFLKAAEWKLAGGSIFGKILKDELGALHNVNFDKVADLLLLSKIYEDKGFKDFDTCRWLLEFSQNESPQDQEKFAVALLAAEKIIDCGIKLAIELAIVFGGVYCIKFIKLDGTGIFIEPKSRNVQFDNVHSEEEVSVVSAVNIINNVHSVVLYCYTEINDFQKFSENFLDAFSSQSQNPIEEVAFLNYENIQIAKHRYVAQKEKVFVLAVLEWEKSFPGLKDLLQIMSGGIPLEILDKEFFYKKCDAGCVFNGQDHLSSKLLSVIAVSFSPTEKPFVVLLTNAVDDTEAIKKAVFDFLLTWPSFGTWKELPVKTGEKRQKSFFQQVSAQLVRLDQASSMLESFKAFSKVLEGYCEFYFFDFQEGESNASLTNREIYNLSGYLLKEERFSCLSFVLRESDPVFPALKKAVSRFNAEVVFDPQGRRLILQISPHTAL